MASIREFEKLNIDFLLGRQHVSANICEKKALSSQQYRKLLSALLVTAVFGTCVFVLLRIQTVNDLVTPAPFSSPYFLTLHFSSYQS
jgi:hypothetical protein